jgi:hypothetical protein
MQRIASARAARSVQHKLRGPMEVRWRNSEQSKVGGHHSPEAGTGSACLLGIDRARSLFSFACHSAMARLIGSFKKSGTSTLVSE